MNKKASLVITSIAGSDNKILRYFAGACAENNVPFILIGDSKSPANFELEGCDYYDLARQRTLPNTLAKLIPEKRYSRKNIGYLVAIAAGSEVIIETDDDNYAKEGFWDDRHITAKSHQLDEKGWVNVYRYFTKLNIWPRGFALQNILDALPELKQDGLQSVTSPIQQGLADENPDIDAIYRLTLPLPFNFEKHDNIALGLNSWCPFNSQNTTWFKEAFALLYLPSYCSFRMTDIWRSFVAQRICWENGWTVLFHNATAWQERNDHNLLKDFEDEIPGYLHNPKIVSTLQNLNLKKGQEYIAENLVACYQALVDLKVVDAEEMELVHAWISDLEKITH